MLCKNCGAENDNRTKFCKECGSSLGDHINREEKTLNSNPVNTDGKNTKDVIEKIKGIPKKIFLCAGAVAAVLIAIILIASNSGKTIDLNKYLTVEAEGYNGYGTASAVIDWDAIEEKCGSKLSFTPEVKKEYSALLSYVTPIDFMKEYISVELDEDSKLSNGSTITYTWEVQDELMDYLTCKVKYEDDSITVSGLTEVGTFDAFANVKVEFSGISSDGNVTISYEGSELTSDDFYCSETNDLSNGDIITVSIDESKMEYYAEKLGKIPETLEKEYKVEGLEKYLTSAAELDDTALTAMQQQASDDFNAHVAQDWGEGEKLEDFTYIGNYLLTSKKQSSWNSKNRLYLIYKAQIRNEFSNEEKSYNKVNDLYWYIEYEDLIVGTDGKVSVDVTNYNTPGDRFTIDAGIGRNWWSNQEWPHNGYQTLEDLYKTVVTSNLDAYNHEDNIDEKAVETVVE